MSVADRIRDIEDIVYRSPATSSQLSRTDYTVQTPIRNLPPLPSNLPPRAPTAPRAPRAPRKGRFVKGSAEAKAYMADVRAYKDPTPRVPKAKISLKEHHAIFKEKHGANYRNVVRDMVLMVDGKGISNTQIAKMYGISLKHLLFIVKEHRSKESRIVVRRATQYKKI